MAFVQKIKAIWQRVSLIQRALLAAVVLTFAIVSGLLVHWSRQPEMRMLYNQLPPAEASKIAEKLSEKGIQYDLRNRGESIYVPREKVYQLRLDMAKEGLPENDQKGYKIFDKTKIGVSPFVQNVNLKRALQEELAKSIQMIEGVIRARVHIVTPEQTLFTSEGGKTTASVVLRLKPGYRLSTLNTAAITNLVSGSVEQLSAENVTLIDSNGRLLSGGTEDAYAGAGAGTVQDYKERVEQDMVNKVEQMLQTVLGPGRATVRVSAVIDMNSTNIVRERYEPDTKVATREEIQSGSQTKPGSVAKESGEVLPGATKKDETIRTDYVIGKSVEKRVDLPGEIKSLSVAALVDLSAPDANENSGQAAKMKLSDVEQIIRNALGLKNNDSLKVVITKFYRPSEELMEQKIDTWDRYIVLAKQASLGIMAICAFLVLRIFTGAGKKASAKDRSKQLEGAQEQTGLLPAGPESSDPVALRKKVAAALNDNPEQVKQLFHSWLSDKQEELSE